MSHEESQPSLFLGMGPQLSSSARQQLRATFLTREKSQARSRIRDLEHALAINKNIISELLGKSQPGDVADKVLAKLNAESLVLITRLKETARERDEAQAKLLISEQLLEESNAREAALAKEHDEKAAELVDQLDHKEYVLQVYTKRMNRMQNVLRTQARQSEEVRAICTNLAIDLEENVKIANVVEENEMIKRRLEKSQAELRGMEKEISGLNAENRRLLEAQKTAEPALRSENARLKQEKAELFLLNGRLAQTLEAATRRISKFQKISGSARTKSAKRGGCDRRPFDTIQGKENAPVAVVVTDFNAEMDKPFADDLLSSIKKRPSHII